jgi:chromosomal replication initiator protein
MEEIWEKAKSTIKTQIPSHSYRMWIEPLAFKENGGDRVVLTCPNSFSKKRVSDHYLRLIDAAFQEAAGKRYTIAFQVSDRKPAPPQDPINDRQLTLPNIHVPPATGRKLRRNFTFDNFVVAGNNDFAYSAALSLATQRSMQQNALFLLSETGLGKSHLSQAIGHHILAQCPGESVYYITAEDFTNEMVNAFRNDGIDKFKEKYRNRCDVLILEDIHFLTGKDRTQIELALALDYLMDAEKKIIFSSCYLPAEIPKINDQLRSRLSCGLIPTIQPPDFQTRIKILRRKAQEHGHALPGEVLEFLAGELCENVRQLESGLIGVTAKASLLGKPIDLDLARGVTQNIARAKKAITIDLIKETVCKHFSISVADIISKSRKQAIARPRHIAIYLTRKMTGHTLQAIGKSFNRYHATVYRSIGTVEKGLKEDAALKKQVRYLTEKLEADV